MTIARQVDYRMIDYMLRQLKYTDEEIDKFFYPSEETDDKKKESVHNKKGNKRIAPIRHTYLSSIVPGLMSFYAYRVIEYNGGIDWYVSLTIEPLTMINGIQHISLFEATDENVACLKNKFCIAILRLLYNGNPALDEEGLSELSTWNATRVDYTLDIKMKNEDEVKFFTNIAKWSARESTDTKSKYNTYGENFDKYGLRLGNKSWEFAIYNKHHEVNDKFHGTFRPVMLMESKNIARIEMRCKKRKLTYIQQRAKWPDRSIIRFLSEEVSDECLYKQYEKVIGYEDFMTIYYAEKILKVNCMGKTGKLKVKTYVKYRDFLIGIMNHKGIENYRKVFLQSYSTDKFSSTIKFIRSIGINPVLLPDAWRTETSEKGRGRGLELPADGFKNPVKKYMKEIG